MSERKLIVLGTSSQVPTRYRNHNGYFLMWDNQGFLFDPGEGAQRQMLRYGISVSKITKICITHFHGDHCLGLAGIFQRIALDKVQHTIEIYYPEYGQSFYDNLRRASAFYDVADIKSCPFSAEGELFCNEQLILSTVPLEHSVEAWGYRIQEMDSFTMLPDKLTALGITKNAIKKLIVNGSIKQDGKVIKREDVSRLKPGQAFAFIMDTRLCNNAFKLAQNADLLVCESTFLEDKQQSAEDFGHLTAKQAALIAHKSNAKKLVLSHYSQSYSDVKEFEDEAKTIFTDVVAAKDGDVIFVPKRKRKLN